MYVLLFELCVLHTLVLGILIAPLEIDQYNPIVHMHTTIHGDFDGAATLDLVGSVLGHCSATPGKNSQEKVG